MIESLLSFIFPNKCVFCKKALPVDAPICICGVCAPKIPYYAGDFLFEDSERGAGHAQNCDKIICALEYTGIVRDAIYRFKFQDRREYGVTLSAILCDRIEKARSGDGTGMGAGKGAEGNVRDGGGTGMGAGKGAEGNARGAGADVNGGVWRDSQFDIVTCVPLSGARMRERGYNQAAILARNAAKYFRTAYVENLLVRNESTLRQSALRHGERRVNAMLSFKVSDTGACRLREGSAHVLLIDDIATSMATVNACGAILKAAGARIVTGAVLAAAP